MMEVLLFSVVTYGCESSTVGKQKRKKIYYVVWEKNSGNAVDCNLSDQIAPKSLTNLRKIRNCRSLANGNIMRWNDGK